MSLLVTSGIFCTANLHTAYAAHSLENSRTGFSITVDNSDSAGMSLTDKRIQSKISKYLDSQENIAQTASVPMQAASIQSTAQTAAGASMQGSAPNSTQISDPVSAPVSVPVFTQNAAVPKSLDPSAVSEFSQPASQPAAQSAVSSSAVDSAASSVLSTSSAPVSNQPVSSQPGIAQKTAVSAPQSTTDDSSAGSGFSMIIDNSDSAGMSLTDRSIQSKLSKYLEKQETIAQTASVPVQAANVQNVQSTAQTAAQTTLQTNVQSTAQTVQAAPAALAAPVSAAETAAVNTAAASTLSLPMSTESTALPKAQTVYSPVLEQYTYAAAAENNTENTPKTLEQEMLAQSLAEHNNLTGTADTAAYTTALNSADTAVYTPALQNYQYALPAASQTDGGSLSDTASLSGAAFAPTAAMSAAPAFAPLAVYATDTANFVSPLTNMTVDESGSIYANGEKISNINYKNLKQFGVHINANTEFDNVIMNAASDELNFLIDKEVTDLDLSNVKITVDGSIQFTVGNASNFADGNSNLNLTIGENTLLHDNSDNINSWTYISLAPLPSTTLTAQVYAKRLVISQLSTDIDHPGGNVLDSTFNAQQVIMSGHPQAVIKFSDITVNLSDFTGPDKWYYNANLDIDYADVDGMTINSTQEQDFYMISTDSMLSNITSTINGKGLLHFYDLFSERDDKIDNWEITNLAADNNELAFLLGEINSFYPTNADEFFNYANFSDYHIASFDYHTKITINGLYYETPNSSEQAEINILGGIINGNILANKYTDILNLYASTWTPDEDFVTTVSSEADINFNNGILYIDNLITDSAEFEGNLTIKDSNIGFENEGDTFNTYYLPKHTVLQGNIGLNNKIENMLNAFAEWDLQSSEILEAQKGDTQTWISITTGGDGKIDFSSDFFLCNVQIEEGKSNLFVEPIKRNDIADFYYGVYVEAVNNNKDLQATYKLLQVDIKKGEMYSLIGNIGGYNDDTGTTEYINLTNGFTGDGGIYFMPEKDENGTVKPTEIYFGGTKNTYAGATEIYSDVTVHLQNKDSISSSKELILHGGANLIIDDPTADYTFDNFDKVILMGVSNADSSAQTKTVINGGGSTITLSGAGKQLNFFQDDSVLDSGSNTPEPTPETPTTPETPETPDTPDTTPEVPEDTATAEAAGPAPANLLFAEAPAAPVNTLSDTDDLPPPLRHHSSNLTDVTVKIMDGASLMVNYLGPNIGANLDESLQDNMNDIAVMILNKDAHLQIKGFEGNTSAHAYFGNGFIRLEKDSSLSLEGGAGLHFSAHKDGFFEYPYDKNGNEIATQDPHKHASIELNGGKLNLVLDTQSHLYSDHILSSDHKHNLIGATSYTPEGGASAYTGNIADDITFSLTTAALDRIDSIIRDDVDEAWAEENHLSFEQIKMLQHIKDSAAYAELLAAVTDTEQPSTLSALYQEFLDGKGETANDTNKKEFNDLLSTLVTVGMNNEVHDGFSFQKYGVQFTDEGAYIYVLETLSVEDFVKNTGINICIKNQVNEVLDDLSSTSAEQAKLLNTGAVTDKNSGAYKLINNALSAVTTYETQEVAVAAARLLDSAAQVATVAGAQTLAWDMLQTRGDSLQRHLDSVKDMPPQKLNLWADMLYMNNKSHNMWTDVNGERDVTADLGGFIAGADYRFHDKAMAGASFAFMAGNAETHLGNDLGLDINNDIYALSASAYAQYEIQPGLRVRGDVGIQHADNNIEMTTPALFNIQDKITASFFK